MAREGYLLHAGKETIHDTSAEKKADTPHKKWNNFWYYHKVHVIVLLVVALVAAYGVWSTVRTVRPDYTVAMVTQEAYPDTAVETMQNTMEKYGRDLNGDGRVVVQIDSLAIPSGASSSTGLDAQATAANRTKLSADYSVGTSIIFLTDDGSFREQEKQGVFAYLDGSTPKSGAKDYGKMRVPLKKCPKLAGLKAEVQLQSGGRQTDLFQNLSISMRVYSGSSIDGKEKDYYKASKELFQKLVQGS